MSGKMVRAEAKSKRTVPQLKSTRPAAIKSERKLSESQKESEILSSRITRSNSAKSETLESKLKTKQCSLSNFSREEAKSKRFVPQPKNTRSEARSERKLSESQEESKKSSGITRSNSAKSETVESKPKQCSLSNSSRSNFSPKKLRSRLEKKNLNSHLSQCQPQSITEHTKRQSKNSSVSAVRFVKLNDFKVDSVVLAKQKYSIPWPARVLKIEKNQVFVYFFGDKRSGFVSKSEIYDFILSKNAIKLTLSARKKQRGYLTGISEIELLLGVPQEKSLLN